MQNWVRPAAIAASVIFFAFLMHNVNAFYIEPQWLGFEDPRVDYAKVEKLRNAIGSVPWRLSGFGHFLTGFAAVVLALWVQTAFAQTCPLAARLGRAAGLLAGGGFLLTGICDQMGSHALGLLAGANPGLTDSLYLANSLLRINFNGLAIVALGWFVVQLAWCGRVTRRLPVAFVYFSWLAGAAGLLLGMVFVPVYLQFDLLWSGWLAWLLWSRPALGQPGS